MTIEPLGQGIRSQSPHLYNPTIQIKYETNNFYNNVPMNSTLNQDVGAGQHMGSPKNRAANIMIDGSLFRGMDSGLMSPQPGRYGNEMPSNSNFARAFSPTPDSANLNVKQPERNRKRKSNSHKMKEEQKQVLQAAAKALANTKPTKFKPKTNTSKVLKKSQIAKLASPIVNK